MNVYAFSGALGQVTEGSTSHHELGTAVDGDEDFHGLQAGGTWSVTFRTDTGVSVTTPRNVANSTIWNRVNYRDAEYVCESGIISWTDYRRVPVSVFDYLTADWTYAGIVKRSDRRQCSRHTAGQTWRTTDARNVTYRAGVDIGPFSVSAQSGYGTSEELAYHFKRSGWVCGDSLEGPIHSAVLDTQASL